ncbi:peroxidase 1-like [Aegilops tauschii subsp. strangulata]|uniref:peroxidase 1-like n=1 Tax=Triticum aestivum TaxID=4565 RepID=UPI001D01D525|nr:peroxidase 1-like [Triticum aestivum]
MHEEYEAEVQERRQQEHAVRDGSRQLHDLRHQLLPPCRQAQGLFRSDAALLTDAAIKEYVQRVATGKFEDAFFRDFSESMIKMANVGMLTGSDGEIRKKCYVLN